MATLPAGTEAKTNWFGAVVTIALTLVFAWQLAHWTWVFVAPPPVAVLTESDSTVDLAAIAKLFGSSAPSTQGSSSSLRLKGVIAPTPGVAASAIFASGGKDIAVYIGREVQPGVKLIEVKPDHVIVSRAGVRERVDLEAPRAIARGPSSGRIVGFKLNVARTSTNTFALSRKELDDALRDPGQLSYLGMIVVPPGGGARMESAPAGSLAAKLGLQPGDVIKKVNGQTVNSTGDLARLYTQFATTSLIQAEVQRGPTTLQLSYQIQP